MPQFEQYKKDGASEHGELTMSKLSVQEQILAQAMLFGIEHRAPKKDVNTMTNDYGIDKYGARKHDIKITDEDLNRLKLHFEKDPKTMQAIARNNLVAILRDPNMDKAKREERLERYFDAYLDLIVKLDREIFPETPNGAPPASRCAVLYSRWLKRYGV